MKELAYIVNIMLKEKRDVYFSIISGYVAGLAAVGLFAANGYLISQAALHPPLYVLIGMVAVVKIGSIIRAVSRYGERYYSHRATFTMLSDLRVHFYEKLEKMPLSYIQTFRSGDLLARIVGDVESLQNFFLRVLYPPIIMVMVFLSTIIFVSFYSIEVVLILTVGLLLTGIVIPAWFAKRQRALSNQVSESRVQFSTEVTEWFQGFRELKIHQRLEAKEQQLFEASGTYIAEQERSSQQANLNYSVNLAVSFLIFWSVIAVSSYLVSTAKLDGVFLAMIVMISLTLFDHSTPMATLPVYYEESERATKRLYSVVSSNSNSEHLHQGKMELSSKVPSIMLNNVEYSYPEELRKVVQDFTLHLPAGSKTAIVGPSGSGKSTIIKLILNLYHANKGDIFIDRVAMNELNQEQLWDQAKVVLQDNHFFAGTIKDNLLLESSALSDEDIEQLLKEVQLPHFSHADTVFEGGGNLSGGEKQRLSMARAIAKKGSLWLLDEPTSSLDDMTAQQIYNVLYRYAKEDTVVLVSHQLSGLEKMDQIVVMDQGRIIEKGNYAELIDKKGYFYQLKQLERNILQA
ncbi:thiol reductant ABC exporter subunit CydC [Bacillus sp. HMF5848]|uniref:thiol reductant ABC exporter subunit CydC n=1 Tax=Bacillus sp. HMF5848 TaxID=2495421 RepID=UPI000F78529E|nr:thiol reductant ABC exporter subunit CydC [Bacillus sp. HMF5848]RSK28493.1 thiol reductant ABC exporter subunit CydC [Bacillus sp. HMF5848]